MNDSELAKLVAQGLIATGVEGGFDNVTCSTAFDGLSIGCSSWEGERADELLSMIDGGADYIGRTYSDFTVEELESLSEKLASEDGEKVQRQTLAADCVEYVEAVKACGLENPACIVYAAMWCPTSTSCVAYCINKAVDNEIDINSLDDLADFFYDYYAACADCLEFEEGYQNRSNAQQDYVDSIDFSEVDTLTTVKELLRRAMGLLDCLN